MTLKDLDENYEVQKMLSELVSNIDKLISKE